MPWPERSLVSVRQDFVLRALSGEMTIAELCREFGVSRKTGYKWLKRFKEKGVAGLVDRSRRPITFGLAVDAAMVTKIVALKHKHPRWGAKKLWALLLRDSADGAALPSISTINRVLYHSGLVKKRRRYRPAVTGLPERPEVLVEGPNDLWTVDFKGWWRAGNGEHCYPLTVRDAFSRYVLELRLMTKTDTKAVRAVFERLFEFYGVPKVIQSDNGPPFASRGIGGLSKLSVWWVALGIDVVRSRPGTPTDNGGHERMHVDVQIDLAADAAASRHLQQHACDVWRDEFNLVRPHEALGMKTPGELYKPTTRRPRRIIVGGHPASATVVHVNKTGTAAVSRTRSVYVGYAFAGYQVALESCTDGFTYVWFFTKVLGRFRMGVDTSVSPLPEQALNPKHPLLLPAAGETSAESVAHDATSVDVSPPAP